MINNIATRGVHAADIGALRQHRAKKTDPAQDRTVESGKTQRADRPAHPHGHIPPGLARAAEKIASKIFSRADVDANGTVTEQELSTVHSRHARTLASSDLFQTTDTQTASDATTETASATTVGGGADGETTSPTSETATDNRFESTTEPSTQLGVTEAELKEALTKFFYAKVGVAYTAPPPPTSEQPDSTLPAETSATSLVDSISDESASKPTFTGVA